MNKFLKFLNIIFIQSIIYIVSKLIPKDKDLIIFGSSLGRHFSDNPKYLYLYLIKKNSNKKIVWITKNKEIDAYLKSKDLPSEYLYSLKGIYYSIRASKVFISHSIYDINGALIGGAEIIQLWHGIALKKIGYKGDWFPDGLKGKLKVIFYTIFHFSYYMKCDKLSVSSSMSKETFKETFYFSFRDNKIEKNILLLGQPRNDVLKDNYIFEKKFFPEIDTLKRYKTKYKKIISWLPTHRRQLNKTIIDILNDSKFDIELFDTFCQKQNILFVIKAHFLELELVKDLIQDSKNIITYDIADPYPLLHFTDVLITDYSSVYFDFLITNRPIIFAPFDLEEYERTAKFYYEYDDVTPGQKCFSWNEIEDEILSLVNDNDTFKSQREEFLDKDQFVIKDNSKNIARYFGIDE